MNCKRPYSEFDNGYIDGYIAGINAVIGKLCQIVDSQNDHVCGFCDHCRSIGQDCKCALTCKFVDCWTDSCEKFTKMV